MTKVEVREVTLRVQKNSQESVKLSPEPELPVSFRKLNLSLDGVLFETILANLPEDLAGMVQSAVRDSCGDMETIRGAIARNEHVPRAELRRGTHLRVA